MRNGLSRNVGTIGGALSGLAIGSTVGYFAGSRKRKKKTKKNRKKSYGKIRRKQKQPYTARKRKDTSHKRIRYTKNNQPYIILSSGKAKFIKKSSVRKSRKMKGGRY